MSLLDEAIAIAVQAHAGQLDRGGEPYILHCLRVMFAVPQELMPAAVLHDVLEDRPEFAPQIAALGSELLELVGCVTRRVDEPYQAYITRLSASEDAKRIKVADLKDNMAVERVEKAHASGFIPRVRRYREALEKLSAVVVFAVLLLSVAGCKQKPVAAAGNQGTDMVTPVHDEALDALCGNCEIAIGDPLKFTDKRGSGVISDGSSWYDLQGNPILTHEAAQIVKGFDGDIMLDNDRISTGGPA